MVSGVAAAVVVPVLLTLQQDGYGTAKGLPSLVLAVAALDDVLAVVAYAISAAIVFGEATAACCTRSEEDGSSGGLISRAASSHPYVGSRTTERP